MKVEYSAIKEKTLYILSVICLFTAKKNKKNYGEYPLSVLIP